MTTAILIHLFYKCFGTIEAHLSLVGDDKITVSIGTESYEIDTSLDCWKNTGHGSARGPEEKRVSAKLMRACADWLDPDVHEEAYAEATKE